MQLDLGSVVTELIYVSLSHTKGGILVHLPVEKVVFTGNYELDYIMTEMKESMRIRAHGEHFIQINIEYEYMAKGLPTANN
jgi:hypothetical protein